MFIYHRDSKNIQYRMPNGQKLKFINGSYATNDPETLAFFRNSPEFGKKEDGAVLFESEKELEVTRTTDERQSSTTKPNKWVKLACQPLYPTHGRLYVCSEDGTKHANLPDLCNHIKQNYGNEFFSSLSVQKEPVKTRSFGEQCEPPPPIKMADSNLPVPPCVGPYPIKREVEVPRPLPIEKVMGAANAQKPDKPLVSVASRNAIKAGEAAEGSSDKP